jgi:hypothetical protein
MVEAREIRARIVADGGHDLGIAAKQLEAVSDVAGAAAELAAHLGNEKSDIEDVNLLGQDVVPETIMEDHDVVVGDGAADQSGHRATRWLIEKKAGGQLRDRKRRGDSPPR